MDRLMPVQADLEGFSGLTRSFASEGAMATALEAAGVKMDRSREALDEVHNGHASSLEISQNGLLEQLARSTHNSLLEQSVHAPRSLQAFFIRNPWDGDRLQFFCLSPSFAAAIFD
jgi:hypothetical protein